MKHTLSTPKSAIKSLLFIAFMLCSGEGAFAAPIETSLDSLYQSHDSHTLSLNQIWEQPITKGQIYGATTAIGGQDKIFIGSSNKIMHALDAKTGEMIWQFEASNAIYSKGCYVLPDQSADSKSGSLLFTDHTGTIYCLDASNGNLLWKNETDGVTSTSSPVYYQGLIYVFSEYPFLCQSTLLKVVRTDGTTKFERVLRDLRISSFSTPIITDDRIITANLLSNSIHVYDLNGVISQILPSIEEAPEHFNGILDNDKGITHLITSDQSELSKVYCVDPHTGEMVWSENLHSPVVGFADCQDSIEHTIIVQTLDSIHLMWMTFGLVLWSVEVEQDLSCLSHKLPQPMVYHDYVFLIVERLDGAYIQAYRISDGKAVLTHHIPSDNQCLPFQNFSIINDTLYYTDRDYVIHAFSLN